MVFHPSDERSAVLHCTHCGRWVDPQLAMCPPCRSRYADDRLRRNQWIIMSVMALFALVQGYLAWCLMDVRGVAYRLDERDFRQHHQGDTDAGSDE